MTVEALIIDGARFEVEDREDDKVIFISNEDRYYLSEEGEEIVSNLEELEEGAKTINGEVIKGAYYLVSEYVS